MSAKKKRRKVRVLHPLADYPSDTIDVDPDDFWNRLLELPEGERISRFADRFTWAVIIDDLENSPQFKQEFLKRFWTAEAVKERAETISGLAETRNLVSSLIAAARAYERHMLASFLPDDEDAARPVIPPLYVDDDGRGWDAETLGTVFARWVCSNGLNELASQFKNLAEAEKTRIERRSEGLKPPCPEMVWRAFCERVLATKRLPVIPELSEAIFERWRYSIDPSGIRRIGKSLGISWTNPIGKVQ